MCVHHFRWAHIEKGNTMAQSTVTLNIENEEPKVSSYQQYGMRYPDGSVRWDHDGANYPVQFKQLQAGDTHTAVNWRKSLESRAATARIEMEAFAAGHQPIRRTITLAVTEPEDI